MSKPEKSIEELSDDCLALQQSKQALLLSSLNPEGDPEISYAPYYRDETGALYVFVSDLAAHTKNLRSHNRASVMFIVDEGQSQNQFARERLIYQCAVSEVAEDESAFQTTLDAMEAKFGNIMAMLRTLQDFHLFRLTPRKGSYVVGFGRAYEIDPATGRLEHISEEKLKKGQDD